MTILESIRGIANIPTILTMLMSTDNALDYNKEELLKQFTENTTEEEAIASTLCGAANETLALSFMQDNESIEEFFENVSYNSERSIPLIIRAINIAAINQRINNQND